MVDRSNLIEEEFTADVTIAEAAHDAPASDRDDDAGAAIIDLSARDTASFADSGAGGAEDEGDGESRAAQAAAASGAAGEADDVPAKAGPAGPQDAAVIGTGPEAAMVPGQTMPWHMALLGDMDAIWEDYTGEGVLVGVYDDGVEYDHEDLDGNYDAGAHATVGGSAVDPYPVDSANHGTSVAGLIAAENNDTGYVGVAYDATITGVNIFDGPGSTGGGLDDVLGQLGDYDVTNHSWGYRPDFKGRFQQSNLEAFDESIVTGRDGLGTINMKAAGNDDRNSNGELLQTSRSTIVVAAYDDTGDASWYSNYGANTLIASPSNGGVQGLETTDRSGDLGYTSGSDYTDTFGGTSGATPIAAGVASLMLEANPDLGWRDVQEIFAYSSTEIGSGVGGTRTADENHDWFTNGADNWNGGGLHFSEDYGYGAVNAYNAVRMAEVWHLFDDAKTSANEGSVSETASGGALTDGGVLEVDLLFAPGESLFEIEYVDISVDVVSEDYQNLLIELVSDAGTTVTLFDGSDGDVGNRYSKDLDWTFGATAFKGETVGEEWTVRFTDLEGGDGETGTVGDVTITFWGTDEGYEDDVYHFTDELSKFDADADVNDTDGGTDWVSTVTMADGVFIDLRSGRDSAIDGVDVALEGVENAVTGDSGDWIIGAASGSELHGMRGADIVIGLGGDDLIFGGDENDLLYGLAGDDDVYGDAGDDAIVDSSGDDDYWGGEGADTFTVYANRGQDTIHDLDSTDKIDISSFGVTDSSPTDGQDWRDAAVSVDLVGGDTVIAWQGGGTLTVVDVKRNELTDDDFLFV